MFEFVQEASMPKLSQTSLFAKFNETSDIAKSIVEDLSHANEYRVVPSDIPEVLSLIKLNGDAIAKKAVEAYEKGRIVIVNNRTTSKVPIVLPYITISKAETLVYIFANNILNEIRSNREYTSLMAALEAAFLALQLTEHPDRFTSNAQLMLTMCAIYNFMAVAPMEQRLYMKGDNLSKAQLYTIGYFYRMIRGELYDPHAVPYKRIMLDKVDGHDATDIFYQVGQMGSTSFLDLLNLITQINPVRYKDLPNMYLTHFVSTCGSPIVFALENPQYLFMLMAASMYKAPLTQYGLNKLVQPYCKKAVVLLSGMNL